MLNERIRPEGMFVLSFRRCPHGGFACFVQWKRQGCAYLGAQHDAHLSVRVSVESDRLRRSDVDVESCLKLRCENGRGLPGDRDSTPADLEIKSSSVMS